MNAVKKEMINLNGRLWRYSKAFSRNLGLVGELEQRHLQRATVAIPGMGGVGGAHLMNLVRMGIGNFRIADADEFDVANFNRQYGATMNTIDRNKADVMAEMALEVNPTADVRVWHKFIDESNVDEFLEGVDVVIDSVDAWAIDARLLIFDRAHAKGIPVISAGPLGFSASFLVQTPDGPTLREMTGIKEGMSEKEKFARFIITLAPRPHFLKYLKTGEVDSDDQRGPSIAAAINLCAGVAGTEALKQILGRGRVRGLPTVQYFDAYLGIFKTARLRWGLEARFSVFCCGQL